MLGDNLRTWLSNPLVAVFLGLVAGSCIAWLNRFGAGFMSPDDDAGTGIGIALGTYFIGLLLAVGLLFVYRAVAPSAIGPFGISLVGSLLVFTVLAIAPQLKAMRSGGKGKERTP